MDHQGSQPAGECRSCEFEAEGPEERNRIAKVFGNGLTNPAGYVLPVQAWQGRSSGANG